MGIFHFFLSLAHNFTHGDRVKTVSEELVYLKSDGIWIVTADYFNALIAQTQNLALGTQWLTPSS